MRTVTELLKRNESALVIFTRGHHFKKRGNRGSTAKWVLNPDRAMRATWLVLYDRRDATPRVWRGRVVDCEPLPVSDGRRRYRVRFVALRDEGMTESNWHEWTGRKSQAPVQYVEA
jgi:hypothetical protein